MRVDGQRMSVRRWPSACGSTRLLLGSQPDRGPAANIEAAKARRADADQRIRRFQAAIAAGVDPGVNG
jgi:hypothetical protein